MSKKELLWLILASMFMIWVIAMAIFGLSAVIMSYMPFSADFVVQATTTGLK